MRGLIMIAVLPLVACSGMASGNSGNGVTGSGSGSARDYAVSGFTAVKLTGSDDVDVKIGPTFAVHATGPSDVLDRLSIERDGDTLKIGRKPNSGFNWGGDKGARIAVTMPAIAAAKVTGSGDMTIERAAGNSFDASSTGSGSLNVNVLKVQKGSFSVTGSGDMTAAGSADMLEMSIAGSGDIDARGVKANGASVRVMGSGNAAATVNGAATVSIMGSGDVDLGPGAKCTTSKLGSGEVRCGS